MKRIIISILIAALMMTPAMTLRAEEGIGVAMALTPETAVVGETITLTVSLQNYTTEAAELNGIRGLQVDVTEVDPAVLEVVEHKTLIDEENVASNQTSYNASKQRVRLMYANFQGTLAAPCVDVMQVTFRVNGDLAEDGKIALPVKTTIAYETGDATFEAACEIVYTTKPVYQVELAWGALDYEYMDGEWQPENHTYAEGGWSAKAEGGDRITVTNAGAASVTAKLAYTTERTDITGRFDVASLTVAGGAASSATLTLTGKPAEELTDAVIGSVTVTLE